MFQSGEEVLVKFRGVWNHGIVCGHRRGWVECRITAPSADVLGSIADRFPAEKALVAVRECYVKREGAA